MNWQNIAANLQSDLGSRYLEVAGENAVLKEQLREALERIQELEAISQDEGSPETDVS